MAGWNVQHATWLVAPVQATADGAQLDKRTIIEWLHAQCDVAFLRSRQLNKSLAALLKTARRARLLYTHTTAHTHRHTHTRARAHTQAHARTHARSLARSLAHAHAHIRDWTTEDVVTYCYILVPQPEARRVTVAI